MIKYKYKYKQRVKAKKYDDKFFCLMHEVTMLKNLSNKYIF